MEMRALGKSLGIFLSTPLVFPTLALAAASFSLTHSSNKKAYKAQERESIKTGTYDKAPFLVQSGRWAEQHQQQFLYAEHLNLNSIDNMLLLTHPLTLVRSFFCLLYECSLSSTQGFIMN